MYVDDAFGLAAALVMGCCSTSRDRALPGRCHFGVPRLAFYSDDVMKITFLDFRNAMISVNPPCTEKAKTEKLGSQSAASTIKTTVRKLQSQNMKAA